MALSIFSLIIVVFALDSSVIVIYNCRRSLKLNVVETSVVTNLLRVNINIIINVYVTGVIHQISRLSVTDTALDLSVKKDKSSDSGYDASIALPSDRPPPDKRHSNPLPQL